MPQHPLYLYELHNITHISILVSVRGNVFIFPMNYKTCDKCGTKRNLDEAELCPICPIELLKKEIKNDNLEKYINSLTESVFSKSREPRVVELKQKAIIILKDKYGLSFPRIAKILKYEKHASCLYLYKK